MNQTQNQPITLDAMTHKLAELQTIVTSMQYATLYAVDAQDEQAKVRAARALQALEQQVEEVKFFLNTLRR